MYPLLLVIFALLIVALYPVIRDFLRQRRSTVPAYVEGLRLLLDGKIEAAAKKLKAAVEEDTGNVDAYIRLGKIFFQKGDIERALRIHESLALRRNLKPEEEKEVYRVLVQDYLKTNRKIKALPLLEELSRTDRNDLDTHEMLLELYVENGSWDKCQELLKNLPKTEPQRISRLYTIFGYAYGRVNSKVGIEWLKEAVKINHKSVLARIHLGDLLLAQGEVEQAIQVWKELLNTAPEKNYLVRSRLERAYYEIGRYEEIINIYRRLLNQIPNDTGLTIALAEIYLKKENLKEARNVLERAIKNGNALPYLVLAQIYLRENQPSEAQSLINEAIQKLAAHAHRCKKCNASIPESEIRCSYCQAWQED